MNHIGNTISKMRQNKNMTQEVIYKTAMSRLYKTGHSSFFMLSYKPRSIPPHRILSFCKNHYRHRSKNFPPSP